MVSGGEREEDGWGEGRPAAELISERIEELGDWRGKTLERMRKLIRKADKGVVEEWKWGIPVWSHDGIVCTGETYKKVVKLTFAKGASLGDPQGLFNSSWREGCGGRWIFMRGRWWTRRRSRGWCGRRWR